MRPPVALLGPTASGKSDVAMAAARAVPAPRSSPIDAMQVYRGMDIGTAKPTAADRAAVVHHCLDLADSERGDVGHRVPPRLRRRARDDRRPPARRALLVAGTGLYLTAAVDRLELPGDVARRPRRRSTASPTPPPSTTG